MSKLSFSQQVFETTIFFKDLRGLPDLCANLERGVLIAGTQGWRAVGVVKVVLG